MEKNFLGKKKQWFFLAATITAIVILASSFLLDSPGQGKEKKSDRKRMNPLVEVQTIERQDLKGKVLLIGQTVSEAQVDIAAKYSGRVTKINVSLGQRVAAGQVLLVQDTQDIELSISQNDAAKRQAQAEAAQTTAAFHADYQQAESNYQHTLTTYQRYQQLYQTGAISQNELDTVKQQMVNAKAALDTLKNQSMQQQIPAVVESKRAAIAKAAGSIAALQKQKADLVLRAPRSGVIDYRQVEEGELVQSGQKLFSIVDNSKMYVEGQVTETEVAQLHPGMVVNVQIDSLGRSYPGKIIYISSASDTETKTFPVRLALSNPDPGVKSGMFARTQMKTILRRQTLCVPKEAVEEKNGQYYLFTINSKNQVERQKVKLGLSNDTQYEILQGIKEGQRVAVSNLSRLKPGMRVKIKSPANQEGRP